MNHLLRAVLAFGIPFAVVAFAPVPQIPEKVDVLGMIRHIHANNDSINNTNSEIVGKMQKINDLAGTTSRINDNLVNLKQGMTQQDSSLANLQQLSQKQIELSDSLNGLANTLSSDLSSVEQNSAQQKNSVQQMLNTSASLSRSAKEAVDLNEQIAGKLDKATSASAEVVKSMP